MGLTEHECNLSNPRIHILNNNQKYISFVFSRKIALSGALDVIKIAEPLFDDSRFLNFFNSPSEIKNEIDSCYEELIQILKKECLENDMVCVGEPIHIARISKEGYEVLR